MTQQFLISLIHQDTAPGNMGPSAIVTEAAGLTAHLITTRAWSPMLYTSSKRLSSQYASCQVLAFDIDNDPGKPQLSLYEASTKFKGYRCLIATTKSHGLPKGNKPAADRFRLVFPLKSPCLNQADYASTWNVQKIILGLEGIVDEAAKDTARLFFPCVDVILNQLDDESKITLHSIPALSAPQKPQTTTTPQGESTTSTTRGVLNKKTLNFLSGGWDESQGSWHPHFTAALINLEKAGYTQEEATNRLLRASPELELTADDIKQIDYQYKRRYGQPTFEHLQSDGQAELLYAQGIRRSVFGVLESDSTVTYMIDPVDRVARQVDMKAIAIALDKEDFKAIKKHVINLTYTYKDDYFLKAPSKIGETFLLNTYKKPEWMIDLQPATDKLPSLYERFFKHFVNEDKDSYVFLLDWMSQAIRDRNLTVLCAISPLEGTGKNTLGEILKHLLGTHNYEYASDKIFKSNFNGKIKNKRMVFLDEIKLKSDEEVNKFKALINDELEIEAKHMEAKNFKNCASYYLASNDLTAIRPSESDRRFSVLIPAAKPLLKSRGGDFTEDEVQQLTSGIDIGLLGAFLLNRKIVNNMTKPFGSIQKEAIREANLKDYERWLIDDFAFENYGKTIAISEVQRKMYEVLRYQIGRGRLQAIVESYPEYFIWRRSNNKCSIEVIGTKYPDISSTTTDTQLKNITLLTNPQSHSFSLTSATTKRAGKDNGVSATTGTKPTID